jgi:archaellum component FlaF (FlaF/FlaG flagellin family)
MLIPKTNESSNEINNGFALFVLLKCKLKNKNQSNVNTKWKKACTNLSKFETLLNGTSFNCTRQKKLMIPVQKMATQKNNCLSTNQFFVGFTWK